MSCATSFYQYSSLPPKGDNIRLLRLLPDEDKAAPLQCLLHKYSLQESVTRTHLYEALSYAWGNPKETLPIRVGRAEFPVTVNLHAALSNLRDRSFERIIWVDAVCIDQSNLEEREQQVQLMAKIYSKAHRVIVWLGKEAADTEGALEDIRLAAMESTERSNKEINKQAILNLLERSWFQRMWVLQEVAAARHVVMICGSIEIDGYAFCLGLKSLQLSYAASPELQSRDPLLYLIERAGLRSKHIPNSPERFSLDIRSLAELIDMFHTREASIDHDKVYALLGMSSDDPIKAGFRPDYKVSWKKLFQQLVKFVLSKDVFDMETSDYSKMAVIKSKGCILNRVSSVKSDDGQNVTIKFKNDAKYLGNKREWTLQASAKSIQQHDIVCLLQGASKPTIIRQYKDYFTVIVIAAAPLSGGVSFGQPEPSDSKTQFSCNLLLVWDWEKPLGKWQAQKEYETLTQTNNWISRHSKEGLEGLEKATRIWNVALVLEDLEENERATEMREEAIQGYKTVIGANYSDILENQYGLTPLSWAAGNGYNTVVKFLLPKTDVDPDWKEILYGRTPLSWAAAGGYNAVVKLLLHETGKVNVNSKDNDGRTPFLLAAAGGHEAVVKLLLLETGKVDVNSKDKDGRTPLLWAAAGGHEAMVKLLLETSNIEIVPKGNDSQTPFLDVRLLLGAKVEVASKDIRYHRTPLSWAAIDEAEAEVKLLLETGNVHSNSSQYGQTLLSWAAARGHEAVVKLLLETGKVEVDAKDNQYDQTPFSWAAARGHAAVVKLLLETGKVEIDWKDRHGQTPLWKAAERGHEAVVKLLLETNNVKINSKNKYGQTLFWKAAERGHEAVVKLLIETGKVKVLMERH